MPKKILIADDEVDVLEIMKKKLGEKGYLVTAVSNGADALKSCMLDKPDLALLDIAMPDMDGYSIASELKKDSALAEVPIIFVTGKNLDHKGMEERISELGAYDYITKPCEFEEILSKIEKVLR
ncbi:PleD family two-component system response regulator [Candidatus Omnitrophota bacterium]